ncbi:MAG TPA: PLDc N-terminal domain-containing protein [Phaeodactylibacter sp.]|nr:PLDc N-terminal domain-containing protein [Phaeodactylibacter sp.]
MPKSKTQLASLIIAPVLLAALSGLLKLEGFEYAQMVLWAALLLGLYTLFVLVRDILQRERDNQLFWILIVLIFFPLGALVYVVRR